MNKYELLAFNFGTTFLFFALLFASYKRYDKDDALYLLIVACALLTLIIHANKSETK
jgi:hypothetical protein